MDSEEISNLSRARNKNKIKWRTSEEAINKKKYVYCWGKYSLEDQQDPQKRAEFSQKLLEYIKISKEKPECLQIGFWDESGFSLRVIRRKVWVRKGTRKKITGQRKKGRVNVMGGLRYSDKKRIVKFVSKGNADNFYEALKFLYEEVKAEWISCGNQEEDFVQTGTKIIIILDNASYHKRKDVLEKISQALPNLQLEFLSTYSPDYNLIELVWHSAKEYIAHRLFQSVEELEALLNKLLNEGELVIKWERKLKNKGDAVNAI